MHNSILRYGKKLSLQYGSINAKRTKKHSYLKQIVWQRRDEWAATINISVHVRAKNTVVRTKVWVVDLVFHRSMFTQRTEVGNATYSRHGRRPVGLHTQHQHTVQPHWRIKTSQGSANSTNSHQNAVNSWQSKTSIPVEPCSSSKLGLKTE